MRLAASVLLLLAALFLPFAHSNLLARGFSMALQRLFPRQRAVDDTESAGNGSVEEYLESIAILNEQLAILKRNVYSNRAMSRVFHRERGALRKTYELEATALRTKMLADLEAKFAKDKASR